MTYFSFLLQFLVIPLIVLLVIVQRDIRQGRAVPGFLNGRATWIAIGVHVLLAVLYTTPWDNYLVATGVWFYNPDLISGVLLGWVPVEEYTFFVLETIFTGFWWWVLARRLQPPSQFTSRISLRLIPTAFLGVVWLWAAYSLISGWQAGTYLALILVWALPPIMLQLAFGADILWHHRRQVLLTVLPVFLYISLTDSLAISSGTWTIDLAQSTGLFIGALPIEEALFFLVTVVLVGFGLTLSLAVQSQARWSTFLERMGRLKTPIFSRKRITKEM